MREHYAAVRVSKYSHPTKMIAQLSLDTLYLVLFDNDSLRVRREGVRALTESMCENMKTDVF